MEIKLKWLLGIGIIGIMWNLLIIGHSLWRRRQLAAETRLQVSCFARLCALCVAAMARLRAFRRPQVGSINEAVFKTKISPVVDYQVDEPHLVKT